MRCSLPGAERCAVGKLNANAVGDCGGVMRLSWNGVHPVLLLLELFMLNSMCGIYSFQSSCAGPTKCWRIFLDYAIHTLYLAVCLWMV